MRGWAGPGTRARPHDRGRVRTAARPHDRGHGRTAARPHGRTAARPHGHTAAWPARRAAAARMHGLCTAGDPAHRETGSQRDSGAGWWLAARRDGRTARWALAGPHGSTAARPHGRPPLRPVAARALAKFSRRDCRAAAARQLGETSARQNGRAARRRDCRTSKPSRGETPAQRLQGESECLVSRAVAAPHGEMGSYRTARPHGGRRPHGSTAARPCGETAAPALLHAQVCGSARETAA
jgi:hypothetical protein